MLGSIIFHIFQPLFFFCCCGFEVFRAHTSSGQSWQQAGELDCVAMNGSGSAMPAVTARLGISATIHRVGRGQALNSALVHLCVLSNAALAGMQCWWCGRLGKQEIVWSVKIDLTKAPPAYQLLWAHDGPGTRWGVWVVLERSYFVCVYAFESN